MTDDSIEGAKEFLLQEHQGLYALHQEAKAAGETRLNFYVTFVAAISTVALAVQSFVIVDLRAWLLGGVASILLIVGLITYRKMLQRRVAIVVYRRRLSRIRAWFVQYYPSIITGLPYDINQNISMHWGGSKSKLGSTAYSVAFINTALVVGATLAVTLTAFGLSAIVLAFPVAIISGAATWFFHLQWKNKWMEDAEVRDQKEMRALEEIRPQPPGATSQK